MRKKEYDARYIFTDTMPQGLLCEALEIEASSGGATDGEEDEGTEGRGTGRKDSHHRMTGTRRSMRRAVGVVGRIVVQVRVEESGRQGWEGWERYEGQTSRGRLSRSVSQEGAEIEGETY